ncbi:MAG: D-alanyl-D-alanine carboxypeptidase/D-alanyl-D-alanine-endopeptidase [Cyanobacteria bacterium P01_A01_bin.37]
MSQFPTHGDRHSLVSNMAYCRINCEKNWHVDSTLNLHIHMFNDSHTLFQQCWEQISAEAVPTLIKEQLGEGWELVITQHFSEWFIHLYQKPQICSSKTPTFKTINLFSRRPEVLAWRKASHLLGLIVGTVSLGLWGLASMHARSIPFSDERSHVALQNGSPLSRMNAPILKAFSTLIDEQLAVPPIQSPVSSVDVFEQAVAIAEQAVLDGRVATSESAWKHLSNQWWSAAQLMADVPHTDSRYAIAQDRIKQYRRHSDEALVETATYSVALPIDISSIPSSSEPPASSNQNANLNNRLSSAESRTNIVHENDVGTCQAAIHNHVKAILSVDGSRWGIYIESLTTGDVVYSLNSDKFFVPASNIKLFTTAAAFYKVQSEPSPAIQSLIHNSNLYSNNWSAEQLLQELGGALDVKDILNRFGVDPTGYHQADGSGLSRQNLATPKALVQILRTIYKAPNAHQYIATLPIAGVQGTLHHRLYNTQTHGRVSAKTGTLSGVRSLSGYLEHPVWGPLAFSILANHPHQSGYALLAPIDTFVLQLMQLEHCGE